MKKKVGLILFIITIFIILLYYKQIFLVDTTVGFQIRGKAINFSDSTRVFLKNDLTNEIFDSTTILDGKFIFSGNLQYSDSYTLSFSTSISGISFILENSTIYVEIENSSEGLISTIDGSKNNEEQAKLFGRNKKINTLKKNMIKGYGLKDNYSNLNNVNAKIDKIIDSLDTEINTQYKKVIENNSSSFASLYYLSIFWNKFGVSESKRLYTLLDSNFKKHPRGIFLKKTLDKKIIKLGEEAPNLISQTNKKENFNSDTLIGKHSIMFFWASWCVPCRKEHAIVNKIFEKYSEKINFVGISIDTDEKKWQNAIIQDNLKFIQVCDLMGNASNAVINYEIEFIPQNYLLDDKNRVILKNIKIEDLEETISKIVNK